MYRRADFFIVLLAIMSGVTLGISARVGENLLLIDIETNMFN